MKLSRFLTPWGGVGIQNSLVMFPTSKTLSINWLREPLLHFSVLAAVLFLVDYLSTQSQREQIILNQQTIDYLIQQREDLELRKLSPQERQETIDQFIEDEILYAESYKRGLDRGDSRMRRNLILKMRGLLGGEVDEPTDEQLREWYENNSDRFVLPETWSLEQVFYSDPAKVPQNLLRQLNNGANASRFGESRLDMPRTWPGISQRQLVGNFGSDSARMILAIEDNMWHGPLESNFGVHLVRVLGYQPPKQQSFETIKRYLAGEWMLEQTRTRIEKEVTSLRHNYDIVIEGAPQ